MRLYDWLLAILLAACSAGAWLARNTTRLPRRYSAAPPAYKEVPTQSPESGDWKVAQPQDAMLHGKWWEIYNDPELNALEEQLNINNQNIKQVYREFHGGTDVDHASPFAIVSDVRNGSRVPTRPDARQLEEHDRHHWHDGSNRHRAK